jgi:hypothetical protein
MPLRHGLKAPPSRRRQVFTSGPRAHTQVEVNTVPSIPGVLRKKREVLTKQRDKLAAEFARNPNDLRLALKIKAIDDEVAACTAEITKEKRKNPML